MLCEAVFIFWLKKNECEIHEYKKAWKLSGYFIGQIMSVRIIIFEPQQNWFGLRFVGLPNVYRLER